jgi:hypothetical protein
MTIRVDKWKLERWILEHGGHMDANDWQLNQLMLFEKQNHVLERIAVALEVLARELKRGVDQGVDQQTRNREESEIIPP